MRTKIASLLAGASLALAISLAASAAVIDFTGGTATMLDATTGTTNGANLFRGVDYYEESGFRLDFTPNAGSAGFATNVGPYYGGSNDVIHAGFGKF